jgi:cytoskeletal protein RodZ
MAGEHSRTGQGGSIVPFIVVGIALVALLIGGLYVLQHRSQSEQGEPPIVGTSTSPSPQPNSSSPSATPSTTSPQPSHSPSPSSPAVTQNGQNSSQMPTTGPGDMMPAGLLLAVLVGLAAEVAQSQVAKRRV